MTILVKNEIDIIEKNIRFHAKNGVDSFVIMDNNSTDGTRELLEELKKEFEITVIDEKGTYSQAKWMTKLTRIAKKKYNPTWLIPNDADEFWTAQNASLKEVLPEKGAVLTVNRYNRLLYENLDNVLNSEYKIINPIIYDKQTQLYGEHICMQLVKISPKVIIKPKGLLWIRGGNHKALHLQNMRDYFKKYEKIKRFKQIEVNHFPIRSYEQFKNNIENRVKLLEKKATMGPHYKRWVKLYKEGKLEKEYYENIIVKQKDMPTLEHIGIIKKEKKLEL
jgi:hypothetical protein